MTTDCLFCRIVRKEIPAKLVHEDAEVVAFEDVNPQAPVHVLVIPRRHVATLNDLAPEDDALMGRLVRTAADVARQRGVDQSGWRTVVNVGKDAHQLVFHVHLHLLAGRPMHWPPG
jgi:histidine triad (HIT) family protein